MDREHSVHKLPVLNKASDFIHWKRCLYQYLRKNDPQLIGLSDEPDDDEDAEEWLKKSTKAKADIVLSLGPSAQTQTRKIIDDDEKTAKELWEEITRIFTTSSAQTILNLRQKLDSLRFNENKSWDEHIAKFLSICDELATMDEEVKEKDKVSKLFRTLPAKFAPLAMVSSLTDTTFENVKEAVQAEIARTMNQNTVQQSAQPSSSSVFFRSRGRGRWRGRGGRPSHRGRAGQGRGGKLMTEGGSRTCYYCGKPGHFIRFCHHKIADENQSNMHARGRGRGLYRGRRGYRGGRGNFNPSYRRFHNQNQYHEAHEIDNNGWEHQQEQQFDQQELPGNPSANLANRHVHPSRRSRFDDPSAPFRSYNVVLQFRSTLAKIDQVKSHSALIDSGATHNFCHDQSMFTNYERIANETVTAAFGSSHILGKGLIWIPLDGGMQVEAYHAPQFHSHILAVCYLAKRFNVLFADDFKDYNGCFILYKNSFNVAYETPCIDGLYQMDLNINHTSRKSMAAVVKTSPEAVAWHNKTGHPSAQRYMMLSDQVPSVPHFHSTVLKNMECIPCITAKLKKSQLYPARMSATLPIHEIHLDISGPFIQTLNKETYAVHFIDAFTAKSDIELLRTKSDLSSALMLYKARVENHFAENGYRVKKIRLDKAGENFSTVVVQFCRREGIRLAPSPAYAPESNGVAERLVQEHWMRARVLMFGTDLPKELWGEALVHANWLRNRLPSARIGGELPILKWQPRAEIDFTNVLEFGQTGFAFIYRSHTVASKKFLPRSEPARFVGMESDSRLIRVFIPTLRAIKVVRRNDFRVMKNNHLPGISTLLDGLSRQASIEAEEPADKPAAEAHLVRCFAALHRENPSLAYPSASTTEPYVPRTFREACQIPEWADAIDREFNAHIKRATWSYVLPTPDMNILDYIWVFKAKPLDADGKSYLYKARVNGRGDFQEAYVDFDPDSLYAPVASHESIRLLLAFAASEDLILEGGDVSNAYLYGRIDVPIYMRQPTDSSRKEKKPGYVCRLNKALYGIKQAGNIWGSALHELLTSMGFIASRFDERLYFLKEKDRFVIVAVVVDDMAFAANNRQLLETVKTKLQATYDVKMFGELQSFIGWTITRSPHGLKVDQERYAKTLLRQYGLASANPVRTPLPQDADLLPASQHEQLLSRKDHSAYRAIIGGLLYLAVCTRPDISFPIGVLARQTHAPTQRHLNLVKRGLRYIAGSTSLGIHYPRKGNMLASSLGAAVDADWGGDKETRRSTTGYLVTVNGSPIHWKSRRQTVITLSSSEAEYVALSSCAREISWIRKLFWEVCHQRPWTEGTKFAATEILVDSTTAAALANSTKTTARTKHIDLRLHHIRELITCGIICTMYVRTANQPADMLTKVMPREALSHMCRLSGMQY